MPKGIGYGPSVFEKMRSARKKRPISRVQKIPALKAPPDSVFGTRRRMRAPKRRPV